MKKENKTMNCVLFRDKIDDYLEGILGEDERHFFETHLKDCPDCSELIRIQKAIDRVMAEEKNTEPDFYLTGRIMNQIGNSGMEKRSALVRVLKPALLAVSLAAAIFAGILIGNFSSSSRGKTVPLELTLMNDVSIESLNLLNE